MLGITIFVIAAFSLFIAMINIFISPVLSLFAIFVLFVIFFEPEGYKWKLLLLVLFEAAVYEGSIMLGRDILEMSPIVPIDDTWYAHILFICLLALLGMGIKYMMRRAPKKPIRT